MHAAAVARRAMRTLVLPAPVRRLSPPVLAFSRHLEAKAFLRDPPPADSTTPKLDADAATEELFVNARQARTSLPFDDALARVQDLLQAAPSQLQLDEQLFVQLMLGKDIYKRSDVQRISESLGLTPDYRTWTVAINNAVHMRDLDEALSLYDEAWRKMAAPRNSAAKALIRGLVYPQNGGTFSEARDVLIAIDVFKQQSKRWQYAGEKADVPLELHPLMSAIVANPDIPNRRHVIDDILHTFHRRGWKLQPGSPNVSLVLDLIYRCSSHADACKRTTHANVHKITRDERWRVLYHIATMRFKPSSVMSGKPLRQYAKIAEADGVVVNHGLFVAYLHALRDILSPGRAPRAALAAVRDAEELAVSETYWKQAEHALLYRALLSAYGRLAGDGEVLYDLRRVWRRLAARETLAEGAFIDALRAFPDSAVREVWEERVARPERISPRLWANWVEVLCRMGEVDEAYAVYATELRDRHPGVNAGGVLFAAARSPEEREAWAQEFPKTWASVRTQRLLPPLGRESSESPP